MTDIEREIDGYLQRLFPITRSITGEGNRETLRILQELIPLEMLEFPSGTPVYDWTIPPEWNIRDAWIKNSRGEKVVDFSRSNLHVVGYSIPVNRKIAFEELKGHLHYREDLPQAIPYRTSYYKRTWGFCLSYEDFMSSFAEGEEYEVFIDSELKDDGSLTIGELLIPGKSSRENLISTYICHPSMANDNLSSVVMTAFLARELLKRELNYSYRVVFVPETIGAITYCAMREEEMRRIDRGVVASTVGGSGRYGYKQSHDRKCSLNAFVEETFAERGLEFDTYPFDIHGSDERQYSSPGFRINTVTISRDKYYEYDYYHTSLDDLSYVRPEAIGQSMEIYLDVIGRMERDFFFKNLHPECEVMLSRHGLYPAMGGAFIPGDKVVNEIDVLLWLCWHCDGAKSLHDISAETGIAVDVLFTYASKLEENNILERMC